MSNLINKNTANEDSPKSSDEWLNKSEKDRINSIEVRLRENKVYENFEVIEASRNGNVTLRIEENISPNTRGPLLLDLENLLKNSLEKSITIWLEPVGDKSKLRKLRGIEIKPEK
tara:strand:+ start:1076 stop:1420 length:345 start_codon:yes stop_codon:yes gene_type:complete